ncbi:MAG TPA: ACT domain-containing protein, partial [Pirellulales bacterium]|nr:ACT domain-containing protein [Pirellulales bacterium]
NPDLEPPTFRRIWNTSTTSKAVLFGVPIRVLYDNVTSKRATIVQIFSPNRPGLLYTVARKLHDLDLSVLAAKIGTHIDQVVDVFYVVDSGGQKIRDKNRLESVRDELLAEIETFETEFRAAM